MTVINPLKINSINQYDCGNNKYLLTIKLENITYKINFVDFALKNSLILKKEKVQLWKMLPIVTMLCGYILIVFAPGTLKKKINVQKNINYIFSPFLFLHNKLKSSVLNFSMLI